MSKMVTVQAQQMWEHMSLTRKTADFLVAELNEVGKLGWELVSASYHKDVKTSLGEAFCWTAILKRPLIIQSIPINDPTDSGELVVQATMEETTDSAGNESSIFDIQPDDSTTADQENKTE